MEMTPVGIIAKIVTRVKLTEYMAALLEFGFPKITQAPLTGLKSGKTALVDSVIPRNKPVLNQTRIKIPAVDLKVNTFSVLG